MNIKVKESKQAIEHRMQANNPLGSLRFHKNGNECQSRGEQTRHRKEMSLKVEGNKRAIERKMFHSTSIKNGNGNEYQSKGEQASHRAQNASK